MGDSCPEKSAALTVVSLLVFSPPAVFPRDKSARWYGGAPLPAPHFKRIHLHAQHDIDGQATPPQGFAAGPLLKDERSSLHSPLGARLASVLPAQLLTIQCHRHQEIMRCAPGRVYLRNAGTIAAARTMRTGIVMAHDIAHVACGSDQPGPKLTWPRSLRNIRNVTGADIGIFSNRSAARARTCSFSNSGAQQKRRQTSKARGLWRRQVTTRVTWQVSLSCCKRKAGRGRRSF